MVAVAGGAASVQNAMTEGRPSVPLLSVSTTKRKDRGSAYVCVCVCVFKTKKEKKKGWENMSSSANV